MPHKIMPYVLPIASIIFIFALIVFARPAITGFFVAQPDTVLNAEIKITADEILPENAVLHIFLEKDNATVKEISSSTVTEFINKFQTQSNLEYKYGKNSQLEYKGYGYIGSYIFNIDIDTKNLETGTYLLKTEIMWQNKVVSEISQEVRI